MTKSTLSEVEQLRLQLRSEKRIVADQLAVIKALKQRIAKIEEELKETKASSEYLEYLADGNDPEGW